MNIKILLLLLLPMFAYAVEELKAPLGLNFGDSAEKIEREFNGIFIDKDSLFSAYLIKNPPQPLPDLDNYQGLVEDNAGLVKVRLATLIENDGYGVKGRELYYKYKAALVNKYGQPSAHLELTKTANHDEFYQCLSDKSCGLYSSVFTIGKSTVFIKLKSSSGINKNEGILEIVYEPEIFKHYAQKDELEEAKNIDKAL